MPLFVLAAPCPDDASTRRGGSAWAAEGSVSGRLLGALPWRRGSKASLQGGSLHG